MTSNRPLQETLDCLKSSLTLGVPINKPHGQTMHESKQWWKLATVARHQTGINYTIEHTNTGTVLHPVR